MNNLPSVQTKSIMLQTLAVPCHSYCRYCLLSWDGKTVGADYTRSEKYAAGFADWISENRPEISFNFSFGYCMDHPDLPRALDFQHSIGSVGSEFLQLNGLKMRTHQEGQEFMATVKEKGVKKVNFTFYGLEEYHDKFAGRKGDFNYLLKLVEAALNSDIEVSVGIPLNSENTAQIEDLLVLLDSQGVKKIFLFVPHEEGRGVTLQPVRFSQADYAQLGSRAKALLNTDKFKPEGEWVTTRAFKKATSRMLIISLTPENIGSFENMSFAEAISYVEKLDDEYYHHMPSVDKLTDLYGDPESTLFYGQRDLYQHYQKKYIREHGLEIVDVTDERYCGSRRF